MRSAEGAEHGFGAQAQGHQKERGMTYCTIPEGRSGDWAVERFEMTADQAMMSRIRDGYRYCPQGTYTRLVRRGRCIMSDTPAELGDLGRFRRGVYGSVLINGLGLGIAAKMALEKEIVIDVTVIEASPDVIALVGPHLACSRLTIIHADAYEWKPPKGRRWNTVWHDIWDDICADNLEGMKRLHRKYGRRADWQESWCRFQCERASRGLRF